MVEGDIFTSPVIFALQEAMNRFEGSDDENDKIIYEGLRRSKTVWENILIHGLDFYGMTYEQFCDQFDKKKFIMFLSEDEVQDYNKAIEIMNIMRREIRSLL